MWPDSGDAELRPQWQLEAPLLVLPEEPLSGTQDGLQELEGTALDLRQEDLEHNSVMGSSPVRSSRVTRSKAKGKIER